MKKIILLLTAMCLTGFIVSINAQTRNPNQQIDKEKEKLEQLANQFQMKQVQQKTEAINLAIQNGWVIREEFEDGKIIEIMKIGSNGVPQYYSTQNLNAARTVFTDDLWAAPYNLDGAGYLIGEWDGGGIRLTHQEFDGRVTQMDSPVATSSHSTHVAGTMIAQGQVSSAHGMANAANLNAYDWDDDITEMTSAAASGLTLSNQSYSWSRGWTTSDGITYYWYGDISISTTEDYLFGFYDESCEDLDLIANYAPDYLQVWAAANDRNDDHSGGHYYWNGSAWTYSTASRDPDGGSDGYDCLPQQACAKNVLTIGAVQDITGGWTQPSDVVMSTFSSWGPTDDGRIKPDIVANGVNLYSCDDDADNDYTYKDGTSMAAPSTTGTLALLQDYYQSMRSGTMSAASLKGLAINTANEAGSADGPDYEFGWGLLNATGAADLITQDDAEGGLIVEGVIEDGQNIYYTYYCDGTSDIHVTLCWNDPAHAPIAPALNPTTYTLVHDLDLYITDPSSTLHYPWRLNPSSPSSPATNTSYNYRDNVERTDIYSPAAGYYTILIDEFSTIPAGGQSYSLIIRGLETEPSLETYCTGSPPISPSDYEYIENVTFGGIDNTSNLSPGGYANYTGLIEEVTKGGSETITVTVGNYYSTSDVVYAWVDWNQDGDFDDSGEDYNLGNTEVVTAAISVPADAQTGYTTMRVRMKFGTPLACGTQSYSETEDYTLHVLGVPGLWTGLAGTSSWHAVNNWDDLTIPNSTTNVTIPAGTPASPGIWLTDAYCNNITIEPGASISVYDDAGAGETLRLYVTNDMAIHGHVYMWGGSESYDGEIQVGHDIKWYDGSQLHTSANQKLRIYGDWYMYSGADVHMSNGTIMFMGTDVAYIESQESTCYLNNVSSYKTGGAYIGFSFLSTTDIYINGDMYVQTGAGFNGYNPNTIYLKGNLNNHGTFIYNYGTLALTGSSQYIRLNAGCYLNNFTINSTGTAYFVETYSNTLIVNGNVQITSGALNCGTSVMEIGGHWTNSVGTGGFAEGTGRVIFNGPGPDMQYIYTNETFNIIENNTVQAIRLNSNITVECNSYDWTSGSVSVVAGTFIANDLYDDGVYGDWYALTGSEIYLYQDAGQFVDLFSSNILIYGNGLIKIIGGADESYWCTSGPLDLEINTGGVLDFDGYGITIYNTNLLTETITDGSIKTSGWFTNYRTDFNPTAGTFEFYGGTDARINVAAGSSFHNVLINKSGGDKSAVQYKDRDGIEIKSSKANGVTLYTDVDITNDLTISDGSLIISTFTATIDGDCNINGLMDVGTSGNVINHGLFEQGVTGTLSISGGSFVNDHPYGSKAWQYLHGTLNLSAGLFEIMHNSILLESTFIDNITGGTMRTGMSFRALTPGTFQPSGGNFEFTGIGTYGPYIDCPVGNYFNDFDINSSDNYVLFANTEVRGDVTVDNGLLDFYGFDLSCLGNFYINSGGTAEVPANSILKLDAGSYLNVAPGGELQIVGIAGNEARVTHISTGNYGFSIFGTIGAEYAIFEFMDGNGINVKDGGVVDPVYTFNNCKFQSGAPSPSALLVLNNDQSFTCNNAFFENTFGNTQYNVWKYYNDGNNVIFADASGDFDGEDFDYDPYDQIHWTYSTRTLDLAVFVEGPFNGSTNKMNLGINSILPLDQPFDTPPLSNPSPDWYYAGTESVGAIPNPFIVDWILVQLRDAPNPASALPATTIFTQAAFLTNTGNIVDLDGLNPLTFTGTIVNNLYAVVWTRNHLGIMSANPLVDVGGTFSYNFSTGSGQAYGGTNSQNLLSSSPVIWGMIPGDANATGFVAIGDKTNVWSLQTGETGYLESDYNFDGEADNSDKNDYWLPNMSKGSQIPE